MQTNLVVILTLFLITLIFVSFNNKKRSERLQMLKYHITDLSNKHLELTRQFQQERLGERLGDRLGERIEIPYQRGLNAPLRFFTPVENTYTNRWQKVGVILSVSSTDDTVYNLEQRAVFPYSDDSFEYRAYDTYKNIHINIPSQSGKKIYNKDTFMVPGKESIGLFEVVRDTDYIMVPI